MAIKKVDVDGRIYYFDDEKPYVENGNEKIYKAIPLTPENTELDLVLISKGVKTDNEKNDKLKQTLKDFLESTKVIKR